MGSKRSRGLTLVELMVTIAVALILVGAVIQLFVENKQAFRLQEGSVGLNENSRFARQELEYALRMAGHWGGASPQDTRPAPLGNVGSLGCPGATVYQVGAFALVGIEGFDATATSGEGISGATPPIDCGLSESGYKADTDVLVVRYAESERLCLPPANPGVFTEAGCLAPVLPAGEATPLLLRSRIGTRAEIFRATDADALYGNAGKTSNPALLFQPATGDQGGGSNPDLTANYRVRYEVYFVTQCGTRQGDAPIACEERANPTPTLARLRLNGDKLLAEDLIEGVEALELLYGIDDNSDLSPDRFLSASAIRTPTTSPSVTDAGGIWNRVVSVRVGLLIRNPQRDMALANVAQTSYRLPGREIRITGESLQFSRKAVLFTVQTRNTARNQR